MKASFLNTISVHCEGQELVTCPIKALKFNWSEIFNRLYIKFFFNLKCLSEFLLASGVDGKKCVATTIFKTISTKFTVLLIMLMKQGEGFIWILKVNGVSTNLFFVYSLKMSLCSQSSTFI